MTAFVGPFLFGLATRYFDTQQAGLIVIFIFVLCRIQVDEASLNPTKLLSLLYAINLDLFTV